MPLLCPRTILFLNPARAFSSMTTSSVTPNPRLRDLVFDMDGTLTVPVIDFPAMYRAVLGEEDYLRVKSQSPSGIDILHHIETWSPDMQKKAYENIADFEKQGLDKLQIMLGAAELCEFLESKNISFYFQERIITRNVKDADDLFHKRFGVGPVACGKRAGAFACLLDETGRYNAPEFQNFQFKPDYKVSSLFELHSLLDKNFNLSADPKSAAYN